MASVIKEIWEVNGVHLPVFIYRERRYNNRISITKKGVNLRIPKISGKVFNRTHRRWAENWLKKQLSDRPDLLTRFQSSQYYSGKTFETPFRKYTLEVLHTDNKTSTGKLNQDLITLNLNKKLTDPIRAQTARSLISRVIGADQLSRVTKRIHEINDSHFKQNIDQIRLKNNSSNWGSCSQSGNINISTKTLFAPFEVQDYIFVHELAHRIEMNHSERYWSIVQSVMPEYRRFESWIKEFGHTCEI